MVVCSQGYEQENRIMRKLEQKVAKFLLSAALRGLQAPSLNILQGQYASIILINCTNFSFSTLSWATQHFLIHIRAHTNELISPLRYNCLRVLFAQQACYSLNLLCYPILSHPQYETKFVIICEKLDYRCCKNSKYLFKKLFSLNFL